MIHGWPWAGDIAAYHVSLSCGLVGDIIWNTHRQNLSSFFKKKGGHNQPPALEQNYVEGADLWGCTL